MRILIRELLAFLEVADDEFKLGMTTQISLAAERFAPNKRWHIDTVLRVLKLVSCVFLVFGLHTLNSSYAGWQLRAGGDPLLIYPARSTYSRTTSVYGVEVVHGAAFGHLAGVSDAGCDVGDRRI